MVRLGRSSDVFLGQLSEVSEVQFPEFHGRVIKHDDVGYEKECYQYGSSSYIEKGIIQPWAIIYPGRDPYADPDSDSHSDSDIIKVINYAKDAKIAVAVRTGGHHYCGASSTNGKNIQLDMSETYDSFIWLNGDRTLLKVGISMSLHTFNEKLGHENRFVPHGQCRHVHLGGHVQTGGYGQLGRSFGLLADHVQEFRIITAEGVPQVVRKDNLEDKDLFFAVLGGSPGNFGVLTHITLRVFKDENYPNSRGLKVAYTYDRNRLKRLLDVMVEMAEDDNFPGDYDYCLTVLSSRLGFIHPNTEDNMPPKMKTEEEVNNWPHMILVYAQWANLDGASQVYNSKFFDKIKDAAGEKYLLHWNVLVDDIKPTPMSKLSSEWTFNNVREFDAPYVKRTYMSNSTTLGSDGWTDWVSDRIQQIHDHWVDGCKLSVQIQCFGGSNSRFYRNGRRDGTNSFNWQDRTTAFSWRDSKICCVLDCFYYSKSAKTLARDWQKGNDEGVGHPDSGHPAAGQPEPKFCKEDRRVLWGSHDLDLHANQQYYYEAEKYNRLRGIKLRYDPGEVFSPNTFCVRPADHQDNGLVNAPVRRPDPDLSPFPSFTEYRLTADKDRRTYDNVMAPELEKRRDGRHDLLRPKY